jgi:hypothetical protein
MGHISRILDEFANFFILEILAKAILQIGTLLNQGPYVFNFPATIFPSLSDNPIHGPRNIESSW